MSCIISGIAYLIAAIGAINWGLYGLFGLDLVNLLFHSMPWVEKVVYGLVGASGLWLLFIIKFIKAHCYKHKKCCNGQENGGGCGKDKQCCSKDGCSTGGSEDSSDYRR